MTTTTPQHHLAVLYYTKKWHPVQSMSSTNTLVHSILSRTPHARSTHAETLTSEDSARVRGVALASGAKAMIFKVGEDRFVMCVVSAAKKIALAKVKRVLNVKNACLASKEETLRLTRCLIGAVPPFGSLFKREGVEMTLVDQSLIDQGLVINFNAGLRTESIAMAVKDYLDIECPTVVDIAAED